MSQWSHLYNNRAWQKLRRAQLDKHPLCHYCQQQGRVTVATVCDHVTPHKGNLEAFWNGDRQSLCATCHSAVKAREEAGGNLGCDANGNPLDATHHWKHVSPIN